MPFFEAPPPRPPKDCHETAPRNVSSSLNQDSLCSPNTLHFPKMANERSCESLSTTIRSSSDIPKDHSRPPLAPDFATLEPPFRLGQTIAFVPNILKNATDSTDAQSYQETVAKADVGHDAIHASRRRGMKHPRNERSGRGIFQAQPPVRRQSQVLTYGRLQSYRISRTNRRFPQQCQRRKRPDIGPPTDATLAPYLTSLYGKDPMRSLLDKSTRAEGLESRGGAQIVQHTVAAPETPPREVVVDRRKTPGMKSTLGNLQGRQQTTRNHQQQGKPKSACIPTTTTIGSDTSQPVMYASMGLDGAMDEMSRCLQPIVPRQSDKERPVSMFNLQACSMRPSSPNSQTSTRPSNLPNSSDPLPGTPMNAITSSRRLIATKTRVERLSNPMLSARLFPLVKSQRPSPMH